MNIMILDTDFNQISLLSSYESLSFYKRFSEVGGFEIEVNINDLYAMELKVGRLIFLDSDRVGIIEYVQISRQDNSSNETLYARGIELKDIVLYRVTLPPADSVYDEYENITSEEIVKSLITKHLINPTDTNRRANNFYWGNDNSLGSAINYSTRFQRLGSQIYDFLLKKDMLGLVLTVDIANKCATYEVKQGMDRTIGQTVNPTAIFSLDSKTINSNTILHNQESYINTAIVGGMGEGLDRIVLIRPEISIPQGISRREAFFDESNALTNEELENRALTRLSEYEKVYQIECNTTNDFLEYDIGDSVTVIDNMTNLCENLQITGINYEYSTNKIETKKLLFGKTPLSISQALNSRLSGVENILTK